MTPFAWASTRRISGAFLGGRSVLFLALSIVSVLITFSSLTHKIFLLLFRVVPFDYHFIDGASNKKTHDSFEAASSFVGRRGGFGMYEVRDNRP
jgi:hypothetical protein